MPGAAGAAKIAGLIQAHPGMRIGIIGGGIIARLFLAHIARGERAKALKAQNLRSRSARLSPMPK